MKRFAYGSWLFDELRLWAGRQFGRVASLGLVFLGLFVVLMALPVAIDVFKDPMGFILRGREAINGSVLGALGSVLVGLAALFIGTRIRKHQEADAVARARLALNVDLRAKVIPSGDEMALEVIVEVQNVSARTWYVPMVYLYVRAATGPGRYLLIPKGERNLANYGATLCKLQPAERDQFFACVPFDEALVAEFPAIVVTVEVVGGSDRWLEPENRMMKFIEFMAKDGGFRHTFLCLDRYKNPDDSRYGDRCFIRRDRKIDHEATASYRKLLSDVMIWTRESVVDVQGAATRPLQEP